MRLLHQRDANKALCDSWVLVSAGIGSLYSRVFSSRHGDAVRGILMIDPLHEDLLSRVSNAGRGFMLFIQGVISPLGLDRILGAVIRGRRAADRIWGRSSYQSGTTIFAKLQESLVADSLTKRDVVSSRAIQDKDTPLVVISSGEHVRRDKEWEDRASKSEIRLHV
jgi:pimeloyl-ACP methyl ester carboxylesterase